MYNNRLRTAVTLCVNGTLTETEAARHAGVSRARIRRRVSACGGVLEVPAGRPEPVGESSSVSPAPN